MIPFGNPALHSATTPYRSGRVFLMRAASLLLVLAFVASSASGEPRPAPEKEPDKAPAAKGWKSLFDGKTLGGWEVTNFGSQGDVEVKEGRLILGVGDGCTGVTWKKDFPKINYEIRLDAMRVDGTDFFCGLTFPVGKDPCSLIVGGWGGSLCGLSSLDGEDAASNETTTYETFKNGQWYPVRLRVTPKRITAWVDGKKIVDQSIENRRLSVRIEVEASRPLGLASWCTTAALRNIEYRLLTEEEIKQAAAEENM